MTSDINNQDEIVIEDYYNLLHLHRALLEAKFHIPSDDIEVQYSPYIAELSNRIVDILSFKDKQNKKSNTWSEWRQLEGKSLFREKVVLICARHKKWKNMDIEHKIELAKIVISPFICSMPDIMEIVSESDSLLSNN